ncbi:glycerol-3-phosphate 2-O-acyltransferase 4-like [Cornus florida]|uniref:glycerol-3-phosphate 2-O-acyltransferase 4-like n=1 Tax=Cornus florida TaxID=4283 RepID=UPI0028981E76|nr:glycerol-3-phosphate 2-O-acyltransferase 4-like [Cornus florida]
MVEPFMREHALGTEIEVNPKTKNAMGIVKTRGVLAVLNEFGDQSPDIGIRDRELDHDFMPDLHESLVCAQDWLRAGSRGLLNKDLLIVLKVLTIPSIVAS